MTDLQMPQMTGEELISKLKGNPETASIPVIVFSNSDLDKVIINDVTIVQKSNVTLNTLLELIDNYFIW